MISIRDIPKTRIGSMDRKPVIHFTDSATVHGNAGCNNFFGTFETEGSHVTFGPLGATMMFCENMDVEDVFFKTMPEIGRYEIVRDTLLRLLDKTGGQSIEFRKISNR